MKLEVKIPKFLSSEELRCKINSFHIPTLVLGNDFKIILKNGSSSDTSAFRVGTRFDRFLKPCDRERLLMLEEGKMLVADLTAGSAMGYAAIIRGSECFLVCFRYLSDSLVEHILERLNRLSGYDIGVNAYISAVLSDIGITENGKRLSAVAERLLTDLSDVHRLAFFDYAETMSAFFMLLGEISPSLLRRIEMPKTFPETVALGCGDDILLISAYAISLCFDCSPDGKIGFSANDCDGGIRISFSCGSVGKQSEALRFASSLCGKASLTSVLDQTSFWAFFIRLIADTNLWEISVSAHEEKFVFSVFMPSVTRGEEFSVREPETFALRSILMYFFGE
jgi:hypothetical protein